MMSLALNKSKLDKLATDFWKFAERLRGKFNAYEYQGVVLPNKYFYRYQSPTPAKDLLAKFWRLGKEAEKILEGFAQMKASAETELLGAPEYRRFIADLKTRVTVARLSAARSVNRDLILLYWDIGRAIVEKQKTMGWGEAVVDRVSSDLRDAFPQASGFSPRNLRDTKRFYLAYSDKSIWRQTVAKLTRKGHADQKEILAQAARESGLNRIWQQAEPIKYQPEFGNAYP